MTINNDDYMEELLQCFRKLDPIKTQIILREFPNLNEEGKRRAVFELSRIVHEESGIFFADLIGFSPELLKSVEPLRRVAAQKLADHPDILYASLSNDHYKDKSFFIELCGQLALEESIPKLLQILRNSSRINAQKSAMKVLGELCAIDAVSEIADFLYAGSRDLIISAVEALGAIGNTNAIQKLSERMGSDTGIDVLILNTFAASQNSLALRKLNETMLSHHAYLRNYAKSKLIDIGPKAVPILLENLKHSDADLQIHTLNVLGIIGDESAVLPIRRLLKEMPKNPNVRFAAYEVLGRLPIKKGAVSLVAGLQDPVEHVSLMAAKAINNNYNEMLETGLFNLIGQESELLERFVEIFIVSESDAVFLSLFANDKFQVRAAEYLRQQAPVDTRQHFLTLLKSHGYSAQADRIEQTSVPVAHPAGNSAYTVWAVDDSRMMLAIYKNVFSKEGYNFQLFEFPESALEAIKHEPPNIILTDLNMPNISGLELTKRIRATYSKSELPIILITTQSSIAAEQENLKSGINELMYKPFEKEDLKEKIRTYL
ncbi:MAG: response regulator [Deltaproteobacteria bacterium]|nr:response regulator [Deltaproteobacteria bacterium]MBN2674202.1 response regulator [Deltaproteobacteria bacterium]